MIMLPTFGVKIQNSSFQITVFTLYDFQFSRVASIEKRTEKKIAFRTWNFNFPIFQMGKKENWSF